MHPRLRLGAKLAPILFTPEAPFINMTDELVTIMYVICVIQQDFVENPLHVF